MTLTGRQQALLDAITTVLEADPEIEAAWLGGSLGHGGGDAYSDVDVMALVAGDNATEVGQRYARDVSTIAEPALVNPLFEGRVINVVTMDWQRFDISFWQPGDLGRFDNTQLTPLFNKGGHSPLSRPSGAYKPSPEAVLKLVNEFLRVLGLSVVGIGRQEWLVLLTGQNILRRLTTDLMLEENDIGPDKRGGELHLNPLLTAEQRKLLEGLPPLSATRESILAFTKAIAEIFLPRARALAAETGAPWPADFESATRRHLKKHLALVID